MSRSSKVKVLEGAGGAGFGGRLKTFRKQRGLSQRQVANAIDVTAAAVCNWEQGKARPRSATLARLAETLHVSIDELLGAELPNNPRTAVSAHTVISRARQDIANALSVDIDEVRVLVAEQDAGSIAEKNARAKSTPGVASLFSSLFFPFSPK